MTSNRPPSISPTARDAPAQGAADDDLDEKPPGLSVTQVVASALAAVSSTVLLSYLGVAGTIIGAGIASVLTIVGNNLYTRSILKTRRQMKAALQAGVVLPVGKNGRKVLLPTLAGSHGQGAGGADGSDGSDAGSAEDADATRSGTAVLPAVGGTGRVADTAVLDPADLDGTDLGDLRTAAGQAVDEPDGATDLSEDGDASEDGGAGDGTDDDAAGSNRPSRRTLILSTVAVFVVLLVGVTLVEVIAGRPLSEILRGEEGSGTTISHVVSREPAATDGTTGGTTDTTTDVPSSGTTPSPAPSETTSTPTPTDPPTTVPDPEPTTPVTPAPDPTPGTGGDTGGSGAGSGSGGTDLEQLPGTGTGSGAGSGTGAEGVPGTSGSATS
ncbi:hypothetical protein ACFWFR_17900 [Oerskovia sp. NPDC060287]|uniref:hypothetical protein n=1 Tax=Oerskovia sp. NPDC060287 TaxID=3347095 RepID=UPI00365C53D7